MEYLRKKKAVGSQYPATVAVRKNVCLRCTNTFSVILKSGSGYCDSMILNILQIKAELATKQHLQKCKGMCNE